MNEDQTIARYIDAAAALHELTLAPDRRQRVIAAFAANVSAIAPLLEYPLPPDVEPAPTFEP